MPPISANQMQIIGAKEYPTLWVPNLCTMNRQTKIAADIQTILSVQKKERKLKKKKRLNHKLKYIYSSSTKTSKLFLININFT